MHRRFSFEGRFCVAGLDANLSLQANGSANEERRPKVSSLTFVEHHRKECAKGARYPVLIQY